MFELTPFGHKPDSIFDYFDQFDKAFFGGRDGLTPFKTDIIQTERGYELQAELPGFQKEDIKIDLGDGRLTIRAEHTQQTEEKKENSYLRRERSYGAFARSFDITGIDENAISASYQNGILTLDLPKKPEVAPVSRQIEIR